MVLLWYHKIFYEVSLVFHNLWLSLSVMGYFVQQRPEPGVALMYQWIKHDDMWLRRVAILHQVNSLSWFPYQRHDLFPGYPQDGDEKYGEGAVFYLGFEGVDPAGISQRRSGGSIHPMGVDILKHSESFRSYVVSCGVTDRFYG